MTCRGTYAKRQRKRRHHCRGYPFGRRWRRYVVSQIEAWTQAISEDLDRMFLATEPVERVFDDVGPAPDPELCARLFRSFPKEHVIGLGESPRRFLTPEEITAIYPSRDQ